MTAILQRLLKSPHAHAARGWLGLFAVGMLAASASSLSAQETALSTQKVAGGSENAASSDHASATVAVCNNVVVRNIAVHFSPGGGCTRAIVEALDSAKESVRVQAYSFTSAAIAKALIEAHKRGVKIEVILDKSNRTKNYSAADFLLHAGIPTFIDARHAIAHNKIILIDGRIVITGSFNFTQAAESRNAENLLIIDSPDLAAFYNRNWEEHRGHSVPYQKEQP